MHILAACSHVVDVLPPPGPPGPLLDWTLPEPSLELVLLNVLDLRLLHKITDHDGTTLTGRLVPISDKATVFDSNGYKTMPWESAVLPYASGVGGLSRRL